MNQDNRLKSRCEFYVRNVKIIGALYCIVPALIWFLVGLLLISFRSVYLLRLALSLSLGGLIAGFVNHYGVSLWMIKHRSQNGPSTAFDGILVGAAVGIGTALLPTLSNLIATNHLEQVKSYIIITWLAAMAIGAVLGGTFGALGNRHIDRE